MKRLVSLVLVLIMMLCTSAMAELTPHGEWPIANGGETLTVWASSFSNMVDFPNLPMTKWLEEKTGVHIEWIEVPNADRQTIFNTSIASGDYPDIYMQTGDLMTFAADGVIIPLDELIDEHSVYLKALLDANPSIREEITAPDGHIYAIPKVEYNEYQATAAKMWVYTEWLEAYKAATGAEDPDTIDEFEAMCKYFKENDMNGNGDPNDEIVITGQQNYGHEGGNPLYYLIGAYCFLPSAQGGVNHFYVEDGVIKTDAFSDEMRAGLKKIHEFYEAGYITSEAFTQSLVDMRSFTTTTKDKVVVACIPAPYHFRMLTAQGGVENAVHFTDYTCLAPLDNVYTGEKVVPAMNPNVLGNRVIVTTACENPELAIRWLDTFFMEDVIETMWHKGFEGEDWAWEDGVKSMDGADRAVVKYNNAEEQNTFYNRDWIGSSWITRDLVYSVAATGDDLHEMAAGSLYFQYGKDVSWPRMTWCTDMDLAAEKSQLQSLIIGDMDTAFVEFIMGIRDIDDDAAWEDYKATIEADGLEDFIEICNEYYGFE